MYIIYTFGYQGWKIGELVELARQKDAWVVDVRYSAWSKDRQWSRYGMQKELGPNYEYMPEFGNVNYKKPGSAVELKDPEMGLVRIKPLLERRSVILVCGCWNWTTCHRTDAANYISERLGLSVEHLVRPPKKKEEKKQMDLF